MNRRCFTMAAVAALSLLAAHGLAAEEGLPKAEALMDRYVEVTGGKAAYEKRKSEVMTIEMEFVGRGIKGTVVRYTDSSNNSYSSGQIEGVGKIEEGAYNGKAWENSAVMGPRIKSGAENEDALRDSLFNMPLNWRKVYKAETAGVESVNGEDAYKVVLTPLGEGNGQTMYLSKKTGLVLKTMRKAASPMGEISIDATPSDYKTFEGILYPSKIMQNAMGNQISLTMVSLKANEDIPKEKFEPPADIKKLMKQ